MKYFTHLIIALVLLSIPSASFAQQENNEVLKAKELAVKMADPDVTIIEKPEEKNYVPGTIRNFSKLYWKLGALGVDNDIAVDNFLKINECDIFKSFYNDDFQWVDVRKAAAKMLKEETKGFSNTFRFMIPIDLGRYDTKRGGFPLVSKTSISNTRRIQMGGNNTSADICGHSGNIPFYPKNIIMILNRPLTFDILSLDEHVAQAFIVRKKYSRHTLSSKDIDLGYGRLAFLQLRVTISHFQGLQRAGNSSNDKLAIVYGKIDAIDVYEDRGRKNLLKSISFERKKIVRPNIKKETVAE